MSVTEWPASDYAIGSYIQATVAQQYLPKLELKADACVLDIGCGNGSFSKNIIAKIPQGSFWGIDASANMLALAKETLAAYGNIHLKQADATSMNFNQQFDYIVSFWCLQWTSDIKKAYEGIYRALKKGAKFLTIFPTGDDPFWTTYMAVRESGQFPQLNSFKSPVDYRQLDNLQHKLDPIPFKTLKVECHQQEIILPSVDIFRKFVNGIAFYQGQIPEEEVKLINEAMVNVYIKDCQQKYQGESHFDFSIYYVTGEK